MLDVSTRQSEQTNSEVTPSSRVPDSEKREYLHLTYTMVVNEEEGEVETSTVFQPSTNIDT